MILVRNTFQVKFGRMKDAMALMKEGGAEMSRMTGRTQRLLTDITGQFYTLVLEEEYESLAAFEQAGSEMMKEPRWKEWYQKFGGLMESGHREIFTIVA